MLLTGRPGVGKTSLVRNISARFGAVAGGFYTEEIRERGKRVGFRLVTLDGRTAVIAHVGIRSPHQVSKYGVDVVALDEVGVQALEKALQEKPLIIVDEIGKMELYSVAFKDIVERAIRSGKCVLGTIMMAPHPWADRLKKLPNVEVVVVTVENRGRLIEEIGESISKCLTRLAAEM